MIPQVPDPSAAVSEQQGRPSRVWYSFFRSLRAVVEQRLPEAGTVTFTAGTVKSVSFATSQPDANYGVMFEPANGVSFWATAKTAAGFTANASAVNSLTVRWYLIRD